MLVCYSRAGFSLSIMLIWTKLTENRIWNILLFLAKYLKCINAMWLSNQNIDKKCFNIYIFEKWNENNNTNLKWNNNALTITIGFFNFTVYNKCAF